MSEIDENGHDAEIEMMARAAWLIRQKTSLHFGFQLPDWGISGDPADPLNYCESGVYDSVRKEIIAARNAFFDYQKARRVLQIMIDRNDKIIEAGK